jgi:hypothetical protein
VNGKKARLRADHHGNSRLKNVKNFLRDNMQAMLRINAENPELVVRLNLQVLAADFNPFRDFMALPGRNRG